MKRLIVPFLATLAIRSRWRRSPKREPLQGAETREPSTSQRRVFVTRNCDASHCNHRTYAITVVSGAR